MVWPLRVCVRAIGVVLCVGGAAAGVGGASPNGSRLVFEGDRNGAWGLSVMKPDGSGVEDLLSPFGAADASWSPNGQQVAFEMDPNGDGNLELFVMNVDGSNLRQITDAPGWDYWPDWFPNGKQIAFTSTRTGVPNIHVVNADGSGEFQLTSDAELGCFEPNVAPNGKALVFMCSPQFEPPTIWTINADGTGFAPLTSPGPYDDLSPQYSPNGKRIVFSSFRSGAYEIWVMDADGANMAQLTAAPGRDFSPTWSPDGRQIAWWKERFMQADIWIMNADGSGQVNVTNTPTLFEGFPDWHQGHLPR